MTAVRLERGSGGPLGATWDGGGVNFAVFSAHAERMELCLYDASGTHETARLEFACCSDGVWHGYLPGARPGLLYGYRAGGPYRPASGHRFNPQKLLLDPYARATGGVFRWIDAHCGHRAGAGAAEAAADLRDNAAAALKSRVVDAAYDWGDDRPPRTSWADTVIYEAHVKGFSMTHPNVPAAQRGRYGGLAAAASIEHLQRLGVTAVELLPVQEFIDERLLRTHGLVNYWGYNPIAWFAPAARYAAADPMDEIRSMVKALHAAGIEVIVDVVYNHTAETDQHGPTLSLRGLDNASYYLLQDDAPWLYQDISGCGNTLNTGHPRVLQLVMDSLRWWVQAFHVDGFRFDLATALARWGSAFAPGAPFLQALRQDPVLAPVKLIVEPWDATGHHTGRFPAGFSEWNDRFRDGARRFWLTGEAGCGELARRIAGSSELFEHDGRAPHAGINFATAHDGFTLADVVSYERRHNEANPHHNLDGTRQNHSVNCGAEGPSADERVRRRRAALSRALLATTALSRGVPMLLAGDELGRSQGGNNNAYCQDNAMSWLDWPRADEELIRFTARLFELRRRHAPLRSDRWLSGLPTPAGEPDVAWFWTDGLEMTAGRWEDVLNRCFGLRLGPHDRGQPALLVLVNGSDEPTAFVLPPPAPWSLVLDTAAAADPSTVPARRPPPPAARNAEVPPRALQLWQSALP